MSESKRVHRDWAESGTLLVCAVLFLTMRDRYTVGPPIVTVALGLVIATAFVLSLVWTIAGGRRAARVGMTATAIVLTCGVIAGLAKVVYLVIYHANAIDGIRLIQTALVIWVGNVVVFAILYNLIGDREFAFPRPEHEPPDRPMQFLDYVFLSFTTSTAFSPTDTPPLSTRARMLMMTESTISLLTIAVAAARAINILPQSA